MNIESTVKEFDMAHFFFGSSVAGTNTHSIDFRKSAGGFIHGFRYTGMQDIK